MSIRNKKKSEIKARDYYSPRCADNWDLLANAVIENAAREYRDLKKNEKKTKKEEDRIVIAQEKRELENFFMNEKKMEIFTNVSGKKILEMLKAEK